MAIPGQALTNPVKIYATLDDFCKFSGLNGANKYFIDPSSQEGQQAQQQASQGSQQQQQQQQQLEMEQIRQQAEIAKSATTTAEAQMANVQLKGQIELGKHQREMEKQTFVNEIERLKSELAQVKIIESAQNSLAEVQFKYDQLSMQTAIKLTEIEATSKTDQDQNYMSNEDIMDEHHKGQY